MLICLALAILTVIVFWQLKDCGFISFDDPMYVYENATVQSGLNANSIKSAFSPELAKLSGHWHPLTWLSWMLDYELFGLNASGFHLVNLLFHVLNTLLLFLVLRRMTKALWPSAFVAALFAIHPLHVESVAWIAERKDVLSTFFWMLTLGAYSYYVESPGWKRYVFVLLFFVLGLLSKPMLITLPFVLLLLDYWPLNRFSEIKPAQKIQPQVLQARNSDQSKKKSKKKQVAKGSLEAQKPLVVAKPAEPEFKWSLIFPLVWEKVPLFVLAALSSSVTYLAAQSVGAVASTKALPLSVRIGNAFVSYITYIGKMFWPANLAVFYPYPKPLMSWQVWGAILFLVTVTGIVIWRAKKSPYLLTGWLWYLSILVPVIGIVQAGPQAMADRYTYLSLIGLFLIAAWGVPDLLKKLHYRKEILTAVSVLIILGLSMKTWIQVGYWQDSLTLYDHSLKVTVNSWLIHYNRGVVYGNLGNTSLAIDDYSRAIEIAPRYVSPYINRGIAYAKLGNYSQAIKDYDKAIEIKPRYSSLYNNRGNAFIHLGNYSQAIKDYSRAIEIKPDYAEAHYGRGLAYAKLDDYRQALENFNKTIEIKPDFALAFYNRSATHLKLGNNSLAVKDLQRAAILGHVNAKNILKSQGISW